MLNCLFLSPQDIDTDHIESWISHLSDEPRSQQLITKEHKLLTAFEEVNIFDNKSDIWVCEVLFRRPPYHYSV